MKSLPAPAARAEAARRRCPDIDPGAQKLLDRGARQRVHPARNSVVLKHPRFGGEMLWICRECGTESSAEEVWLVAAIGWTGLDGDTGVCAPCSTKNVRRSEISVVHRVNERLDRSDRAL